MASNPKIGEKIANERLWNERFRQLLVLLR